MIYLQGKKKRYTRIVIKTIFRIMEIFKIRVINIENSVTSGESEWIKFNIDCSKI